MNTYLDCVPCFMRQALEAARNATDDHGLRERILRDVLRMASEMDLSQPPPAMGQAIHRRVRELTGAPDPYRAAKRKYNAMMLAALPELRAMVSEASEPMLTAAALAIAANAIDMGVTADLAEDALLAALRGAPKDLGEGAWAEFRHRADVAQSILYLADNAGEIVADRLLIEELGPDRVTLVVRGAPILNDVTLTEAEELGLTEVVEVIDNGSDSPGTLLDDCSESLRDRFEAADLIIAKGQGNYESLSGAPRPISFLLKIKCPVIAGVVDLPVGTHALLHGG
ncbi:MAG: DUF89 family protein [Armatimonadia bacterium]|nr:DUF89 family protein [Armatimonadia bacterium]